MAAVVSTAVIAEEWTPLFNGTDFSGWTFDTMGKAVPESIWTVNDATVIVSGRKKPGGVLRTEKSYSNYEFEFEWRWPDKAGNSGCLIHTSSPHRIGVWPQSIEVQLMSGNAGDFWLIGEAAEVKPDQIVKGKDGKPGRRRAKLSDNAEKPVGEWNLMRIIAKGDTIEVYVNGTLVNKAWNTSVQEGAICLQAEGANIEFRNIRIKTLPVE